MDANIDQAVVKELVAGLEAELEVDELREMATKLWGMMKEIDSFHDFVDVVDLFGQTFVKAARILEKLGREIQARDPKAKLKLGQEKLEALAEACDNALTFDGFGAFWAEKFDRKALKLVICTAFGALNAAVGKGWIDEPEPAGAGG